MRSEESDFFYDPVERKRKEVGFLRTVWAGIKAKPVLFILMIFFSFSTSAFFTFASDGLCIAVRPVAISTRLTRYLAGDICKSHSVCHVYFTLAEDPSTSAIVNFHTRDMPLSASVTYGIVNSTSYRTVEARWNKMDIEIPRYVYWADIDDLLPDTPYSFTPSYVNLEKETIRGPTRMIRTVPLSGNITFVTGGDMENDESGYTISKLAGSKSPYFAMLGGDVAYANGDRNCYMRWDEWFNAWTKYTITPQGYDLPFSIALGNHEAGGDHGTRETIGFFLAYFPQTLGLYNVDPLERPIHHSHSIGEHSTMMVLDSGIVEPMTGLQLEWIENHLNSTKAVNRFAMYHYSLYPSITEEVTIDPEDRKSWVDAFSRLNLTAGFENHYHVFKRSKTVKHDAEVASPEDGTTFFGDGAWGIESSNPFLNPNSWWIDSVSRTPHFFLVTTSETGVTVHAINHKDEIFDKFALKR